MNTKELGNKALKQNEKIIEWCNGILSQNVPEELVKEVVTIKIEAIEQIKILKDDLKQNFDEVSIKRFERTLNEVIEQNEEILIALMFLAADNI